MDGPAKISRRNLSPEEAAVISREITRTPNIIGYRPEDLLRLSNVLVAENKDGLMGILAYTETQKFIDLKLALVLEKYRGQGCGTKLFNEAVATLKDTDKPLYAVTKNQTVIRSLESAGFKKVRFAQLPLPCMLHQLKMAFSFYRTKEYFRKLVRFPHSGKFTYWLRLGGVGASVDSVRET